MLSNINAPIYIKINSIGKAYTYNQNEAIDMITAPKTVTSYKDTFVKLYKMGKSLYEKYKNDVQQIDFENYKEYLIAYDYLVLTKEIYDISIIKKFKNFFMMDDDKIKIVEQYTYDEIKKESSKLIDFAIFSYLLITSLKNSYSPNNDIEFKEYFAIDKNITIDKLFLYNALRNKYDVINKITEILNIYKVLDKNLLIFKSFYEEYTDNNITYYIKGYNTIYGLYLDILNFYTISIRNGFEYFTICNCGTMIEGKSKRCNICKKNHNSYRRKINMRKSRKKQK